MIRMHLNHVFKGSGHSDPRFRVRPEIFEGPESLKSPQKTGLRKNPDPRISAPSDLGSEGSNDPKIRVSDSGPHTLMLFHPKKSSGRLSQVMQAQAEV